MRNALPDGDEGAFGLSDDATEAALAYLAQLAEDDASLGEMLDALRAQEEALIRALLAEG